jgi:NAD(P)-dependent dehydrogenase (short-subunit alcohol dehydrogenase family)
MFTANHLCHFMLTNLLLPDLEKTKGRIVNVSSSLHKTLSRFDFENIMAEKSYEMFTHYAQSKLANVLFTIEMQKK